MDGFGYYNTPMGPCVERRGWEWLASKHRDAVVWFNDTIPPTFSRSVVDSIPGLVEEIDSIIKAKEVASKNKELFTKAPSGLIHVPPAVYNRKGTDGSNTVDVLFSDLLIGCYLRLPEWNMVTYSRDTEGKLSLIVLNQYGTIIAGSVEIYKNTYRKERNVFEGLMEDEVYHDMIDTLFNVQFRSWVKRKTNSGTKSCVVA